MARMYFHVQCDRCGAYAPASHAQDNVPSPPVEWTKRSVIPGWAFVAKPVEVLICRDCAESIDARMRQAWSAALTPDPQPAPSKEPPP